MFRPSQVIDEVVKMSPSWDAMLALEDEDLLFTTVVKSCYFLSNVSSDKSVRDASVASKTALNAYEIEKTYREDVYKVPPLQVLFVSFASLV